LKQLILIYFGIILISNVSISSVYSDAIPMSPRQQMANGIAPENVICKEGLELVIRSSDGTAACVKQLSSLKLAERGWGFIYEPIEIPEISKSEFRIDLEKCNLSVDKDGDGKPDELIPQPGTDWSYCNLVGADLTYANFYLVNLTGADLSGMDLTGKDLSAAFLTGANFTKAKL